MNSRAQGSQKPGFRHQKWLHACRWLSPFFVTCAIYFLLWVPEDPPSWFGALVKCLPLLCLVLFQWASGSGVLPQASLLCSALGDACLIWPEAFLHGMASFALAHLLCLWTLGLVPLRPRLLLPIALFSAVYFALLLPHIPPDMVLPSSVYALVLSLLLWRGLARGPPASWGTLLFTLSDSVLAWGKFVRPLPLSRLVVMATYYAAQLLLALSAIPSPGLKTL